MVPIPINLAVEDSLSEAVVRKVIRFSRRPYVIGVCFSRGGFGYLKKMIKGFNNAAKGTPYFVLTDLDTYNCAPFLIRKWLPVPKHPNLIFRVAVREVEAWLLADQRGFASYLGIQGDMMPQNIDAVSDPKQTLINLAKKSRRRELKDAIVPRFGGTSSQGPDYNGALISFVNDHWNIHAAMKTSQSLKKAVNAIVSFNLTFKKAVKNK